MLTPADIDALATGRHADPFAVLGMHQQDGHVWVRALLPGAHSVQVIRAATGHVAANLKNSHPAGLFEAPVSRIRKQFAYSLKVEWGHAEEIAGVEIEDPYRFPPVLGELDVWLLAEGRHATKPPIDVPRLSRVHL